MVSAEQRIPRGRPTRFLQSWTSVTPDKVIITAALTGSVHTPTMSPYLPITPEQIVEEAVRSYDAGAAVAHIHVRDPGDGRPVADPALFRDVTTKIAHRCPIITCITTGGGAQHTLEQRITAVRDLRPELASLNAGSMNFATFPWSTKVSEFKYPWERQALESSEDFVFSNTFKTMRSFLEVFQETQTKPELEVYDLGMVNNIAFHLKTGALRSPVYVQFVLGILGGAAASVDNLTSLCREARDVLGDFSWSVCAAGRHQIRMCTVALAMGGNVRVGLEDNIYLERGVLARSSAEQVSKIARIASELGREPATPDEARRMLGVRANNHSEN
jgi:uncharacterized protein (DUF849 family)